MESMPLEPALSASVEPATCVTCVRVGCRLGHIPTRRFDDIGFEFEFKFKLVPAVAVILAVETEVVVGTVEKGLLEGLFLLLLLLMMGFNA